MTDLVEKSQARRRGAVEGGWTQILRAPTPAPSTDLAAASSTASDTPAPANRLPMRLWSRQLVTRLVVVDTLSVLCAVALGLIIRRPFVSHTWTVFAAIGISVAWLLCLQLHGGYDVRRISDGPDEFLRVLRAAAVLAGAVASLCFLMNMLRGRTLVAIVIPIGTALMLAARFAIRRFLHRQRAQGAWTNALLAVGTSVSVAHLAATVSRRPQTGLRVVGACVEDVPVGQEVLPGVTVVGDVARAAALADELDVDVVAVAGSGLGPQRIRELGWALEGTRRQMVIASDLTNVAGPRVHISPVQGLPLMWVDQPQFTGVGRVVKRAVDIVGGLLAILLISPILVTLAAAIRMTSRGPVLYTSRRVGKDGREFTLFKFRSMVVDAEQRRAELIGLNKHADGVLFKIRRDPRVTPIGRFMRKFSLDELPQLFNVVNGTMSLVGPRPPLPDEVERYANDARRRMLVKPGMTGLWQVSGRSDLSWDESVRLDLYYVENWSLVLDLSIILRTVWAVVASRGAY